MTKQPRHWLDKIVTETIKEEVPGEIYNRMAAQIDTFCQKRKDVTGKLGHRFLEMFSISPPWQMAKNGLLTLIFVFAVFFIPAAADHASLDSSAESFEILKYNLTLMVALEGIEEMESTVHVFYPNGEEKQFKTHWKWDEFIISPIQEGVWLNRFLAPNSLKIVLANNLIPNKQREGLNFYIRGASGRINGQISFNRNYLPLVAEGLSGPLGETARIVYHCKEYFPSSPWGTQFIRRKTHE